MPPRKHLIPKLLDPRLPREVHKSLEDLIVDEVFAVVEEDLVRGGGGGGVEFGEGGEAVGGGGEEVTEDEGGFLGVVEGLEFLPGGVFCEGGRNSKELCEREEEGILRGKGERKEIKGQLQLSFVAGKRHPITFPSPVNTYQ